MCSALRSPEDPRDWIFEGLGTGNEQVLPPSHSLMHLAPEIRDQGQRGTCAAFVGAGIKSMILKKLSGASIQLSPEFIYYHRENKPANGMYGRNVFQVLQRLGVPEEEDYPYGTKKKPTKSIYARAQDFKISNYAKITTMDGLKRALYEIGPCYLLLPLFKHRPYFWRNIDNEPCDKTHAVIVVGYNKEGFIIINSWGGTWNDTGTCTVPFDDWCSDWEMWVCMDGDIEELVTKKKMKRISRQFERDQKRGRNRKYNVISSRDDSMSLSKERLDKKCNLL